MKSPRTSSSLVPLFLVGAVVWLTVTPVGAEQNASNKIQQEVEHSLRGDDYERVTVSVIGSEVTLTGRVPHLLAKNDAIRHALEIDGVETIASELQLPEEEEDTELAQEVGKAIRQYPHFTIWDYVDGRINQGVVTLQGSVTPARDKKRELYETIAKIRGVQDYIDEIEVQSSSSGDERLRRNIGRNLAMNQHFERTISMRNPPYHIIVNRSSVALVGYVQTQIEYREMERIVRMTQGVLKVDNQLQTLR
jgi:osmotically-inducible protein OsmY